MSGDYISRKAAISALRLVEVRESSYNFPAGMLSELKSIPAANVVEVVRCRDCENWDTEWEPSHVGEGEYFCPILDCVSDQDFYCGCGKRKDGGQDA